MRKNFSTKIAFVLIVFITLSLYSCELLTSIFGYPIEGTKWSGVVILFNMVIEFENNGIVKTAFFDAYGIVERNQGTYTFDKQSLTGTINMNGSITNFSIDEKANTLTLSASGISFTFQNVTKTFSWPTFSLTGKRYKGMDFNGKEWTIYFSTSSSGVLSYTIEGDSNVYQYNFTYTWDNANYKGVITTSSKTYEYKISYDQKYCLFDSSSDDCFYCELQQ